mmetsp:Transcript_34181/g.61637  ORF Transcript_34181/g.61637 Transcript_34181/m.61637 type:complete len:470 (-) Transcript_34181:2323-3732(-)|eukprot:CAMPEP_0175061864 /NCGR_PEP_ID=MMETSP0052_2-20121109/13829_1 /TAXON_ID=51329 ORGANISM="Polytomella parva, Strain SAG 63-3" /NCGR_SAMPLE_ID=MMETSP0052_2 /ASSEMBLY_ACC=CAM_ASM_000194 /LENGTH=469 /DNA_ID=CAMNT_0016327781 /DNA_START=9 /DNA_END=1418 /DNA_ORIENTATION=-
MPGYESSRRTSRRSRSRSRSRSRDRRRVRSRTPDRHSRSSRRHRSRTRSRTRSPPRRQERERTPPEVVVERMKERESEKLERATTTVFVYNLNLKADERNIYEFFSKAGKVKDIKLITDRSTRKSKGFAYVEFSKAESVFAALSLSGELLMGQAVMVKMSEAEKNMAWEAQQQLKQAQTVTNISSAPIVGNAPLLIQVFGLHKDMKEGDIEPLFVAFGPIDFVRIVRDAEGASLGYANIQYQKGHDAAKALDYWDGREVGDVKFSVKLTTQTNPSSTTTAGGVSSSTANPSSIAAAPAAETVSLGEIDDDDDDLKLNAKTRAVLMSKLASGAGLVPVQAPAPTPVTIQSSVPTVKVASNVSLIQSLLGPASPIPTQCLVLKNMFSPEDINSNPDTLNELTADIRDAIHFWGALEHLFVDTASMGCVYVKLSTVSGAQGAFQMLNGRWYSGRQIGAEFQFLTVYNQHFGL